MIFDCFLKNYCRIIKEVLAFFGNPKVLPNIKAKRKCNNDIQKCLDSIGDNFDNPKGSTNNNSINATILVDIRNRSTHNDYHNHSNVNTDLLKYTSANIDKQAFTLEFNLDNYIVSQLTDRVFFSKLSGDDKNIRKICDLGLAVEQLLSLLISIEIQEI